ncbi:MAG: alanine--tRNA ligase [Candidatus Nomurabacteria bacterium]|nr:alanine--tRNA ligase [Candidatus Nomurabacteria bacterium]
MHSSEIRTRFLKFFEKRGHNIIHSASLLPDNDPSVLFNTAGMQPLVPYLLGQEHTMGKKIANIQKCVRTGDLDSIGDNRHFSFFEMMGNWSLGDYFKNEAITWSYEFLTSKEEGLGLNPNLLYITCFEGDKNAPRDIESFEIWKSLGIPESRIYFLEADDNWWSPGENGPCGPCSEMFYDMTENKVGDLSKDEFINAVKTEDLIEIWNDVFMEYEKKDGEVIGKLKQKNVDTGAGVERMTAIMQNKRTAYDTDLFEEIMNQINSLSSNVNIDNLRERRIVADHVRSSVFMINDGVISSNSDRGYVLRRLLRRAVRFADQLGFKNNSLMLIAETVISKYKTFYNDIELNSKKILEEINNEEIKFRKTLHDGVKHFNVLLNENKKITGYDAFVLYTTYGFPVELIVEFLKEKGIYFNSDDIEKFNIEMKVHQKLSQTASAGMFKGGLANHNDKTIKLHTAHHLLLAGLQEIVSKDIKQRGSNITEERLRMDFICDHKLTDEEKINVEAWVNDKINRGLSVVRHEMPLSEAEKIGAQMEFGAKYPDIVSVYIVEDEKGLAISKEFCGGPHVKNTKELGQFKIQKEEAVAAGIRRIKANLI